jgi:hypothetical protein
MPPSIIDLSDLILFDFIFSLYFIFGCRSQLVRLGCQSDDLVLIIFSRCGQKN